MEDWEECVWEFSLGNLESFVRGALDCICEAGSDKSSPISKMSKGVREVTEVHVKNAIDVDSDRDSRAQSSQLVGLWMENIPRLLVASDPDIAWILLAAVEIVLENGLFSNEQSLGRLKQFYTDTDILNLWPRMDPTIWSRVIHAYSITFEANMAIQDEIDELSTSVFSENTGTHSSIRDRLNDHLRRMKSPQEGKRDSLADFVRVFQGLDILYDLVDLSLFLEAFPEERFLSNPSVNYKASFARKLALTAVKEWVEEHRQAKKNRESRPKGSTRSKEHVIDACIKAHLNITDNHDRDCEYFYSCIRKHWLASVIRSGRFHIYEIFDHIDDDPGLSNQLLFQLEDDNRPEEIASLLTWSEQLRCDKRRRMHLDDQFQLMLMSFAQTGRKELMTSVFGPLKEGAFVLPFSINTTFDGSMDLNLSSYEVLIVDQLAQVDRMSDFFSQAIPRVVHIDVFSKYHWSYRLERPVPSVVSVTCSNKVFLVMTKRMPREARLAFRELISAILRDTETLKVLAGTRQHDKFFSIWTLLADDPFRPPNTMEEILVSPYLDLCHVFDPKHSFSTLVYRLLGGLVFCDYEENSDWSKADCQFLRESQLHYLASRAWLSLQLFHTIQISDTETVRDCLGGVDLGQVFGSKFFVDYTGPNNQVYTWLEDNQERLAEAHSLVFSSKVSQDDLRREVMESVLTDDSNTLSLADGNYEDDLASLLESFRI